MQRTVEALLKKLDGTPIRKQTQAWQGFFQGSISVSILNEGDTSGAIRACLAFDTSPGDINDYIHKSDIDSGSTSRVQLVDEDGDSIPHKVLAVRRIGLHEESIRDRYEVEIEVPRSLQLSKLQILFTFGNDVLAKVQVE
ncbi:hypothetical protein [Geodermatophilus sp. SYSU D00766]